MSFDTFQIITGGLTGSASLDTAVSRAILQQVSNGELPETLQVGRPHRVVAFGKHDVITPGFENAVRIAMESGFDPTIRIAGGRAVVFHPYTLRFAWTLPSQDPVLDMQDRFVTVAGRVIAMLGSFGIAATMGELTGEYCPGSHSVHIEGTGKVMGSGQRLTRRAAQISGMIVVSDAETVNKVLIPVYAALGLVMDPARTGAASDLGSIDMDVVSERFAQQFTSDRNASVGHIESSTMDLAIELQPDHDPRVLA